MTDSPPEQFDDFRAYMRFAIATSSNGALAGEQAGRSDTPSVNRDDEGVPEYPAPSFSSSTPDAYEQCAVLATALPRDDSAIEHLLRELQNGLTSAHAKAVVVKWTGQPEERLRFVEIPSRVWRDMGDLADLPDLWTTGFMDVEFPKGFENGSLEMRGSALFFDVRFNRALINLGDAATSNSGLQSRRSRYDWPSFQTEAVRILWDEGGYHSNWIQADLVRTMTDWIGRNWEKEPSPSAIKEKVRNAELKFHDEKQGNTA